MTVINIDLSELSGVDPNIQHLKGARIDFSPYRAFAIDPTWVTRNIVRIKAPNGVATADVPPTPTGNAYEVQERGFRGARHGYVLVPDSPSPIKYIDLVWVDKTTLDPDAPLDPAWVAALEAAVADIETAQSTADSALTAAGAASAAATTAQGTATSAGTAAAAAQSTADTAVTGLGTKVNTSTYTAGLALKADQSALTTGLALKADTAALTTGLATKPDISTAGRDSLALADYTKLRPWFAALSNWANKRADVVVFGDSGVEGYSLTSWDNTFPSQLARALRVKMGIPAGGRGLVGVQNDMVNQSFWPEVYTSPAITATGYGANMRQAGLTGIAKDVHSVQPGGISSFAIFHHLYATAPQTLGFKVDAGSVVNRSTSGSGTPIPVRFPVATAVTSTVEFTSVVGTSYFHGIQEFKGDENSGLQVHNCGMSGTYAQYWNDRALVGQWPETAALLTPALVIVEFGINDGRIAGANKSAATYASDLTTFINTVKTRVSTTAPIVINLMWSPGDVLMREPWANYVAAARGVAALDSRVVVVAASDRMYPANVTDTEGYYNAASLPHGNALGYALEVSGLLPSLLPR